MKFCIQFEFFFLLDLSLTSCYIFCNEKWFLLGRELKYKRHRIYSVSFYRKSIYQNLKKLIKGGGAENMEDIERSFVCLCDHPFHPDFGPSFMSCKTTIESVFDNIIQMRQTDRTDYCNMLNPPHVFGIGNSNSRNVDFYFL